MNLYCECTAEERALCQADTPHETNGTCRKRNSGMSYQRYKRQVPQGVSLDDHDNSDE